MIAKRDFVCKRCHIVYAWQTGVGYCDLCGGELSFSDNIEELEGIWTRQEQRLGLSSDFAYHHNKVSLFFLSAIMRLRDKIPSFTAQK